MTGDRELPEDGIIDEIAVQITAGRLPQPWRPERVRLTAREQQLAAAMIAEDGGGIPALCARLGVSVTQAAALLAPPAAPDQHCPTCTCSQKQVA
jgi:hypothetical protein